MRCICSMINSVEKQTPEANRMNHKDGLNGYREMRSAITFILNPCYNMLNNVCMIF